jgi:D-aminoacyl-tRNA deacylase
MKAVVQRVTRGSVTVEGKVIGQVARGYVVFLGVRPGDTEEDARYLAHRTVNLRVFADANGKMNLSIEEVSGGVLAISQFTLYADTHKGNRPSFVDAAPPDVARKLYECYVEALRRSLGEERVATGRFGATMSVEIINDGPVTIELNTDGHTAKE